MICCENDNNHKKNDEKRKIEKTSCENDRKYGKTTKAMKNDKNCCEIVDICTRIFLNKKFTKENHNRGHNFL